MATPVLVIGDYFSEIGTAYAGMPSMPYDLSMAMDIQACVIAHDHSARLCQPVALSRNISGADWPAGRVAIELPSETTSQINVAAETIAKVELQARFSAGHVFTWFGEIYVVPGYID